MREAIRNCQAWLLRTGAVVAMAAAAGACQASVAVDDDNPFMEDLSDPGKEDSGWISAVNAPEVELVLESDIHSPGRWQAMTGPIDLSQFALTHLRKNAKVFVESQLVIPEQDRSVEWLLDGNWVNAEEVDYYNVAPEELNHFRITGVNAVIYKPEEPGALVGKVYEATVPRSPHSLTARAGDSCANHGSHELYDDDYWYFWAPERADCQVDRTTMTATVTAMITSDGPHYPEYDLLLEDGQIEAVIFFGAFGGTTNIEEDKGYTSMQSFIRKMVAAGYVESISPAGLARFARSQDGVEYIVDVSGPEDFAGLGDFAHAGVFDEGVRTHEIVIYNGHSILGTSAFWQREGIYPDYYQIFFFNGCLGYEYYVRAILDGKGSWDKTDVVSNIMETPAAPQPKVIATFLAATFQGAAESGRMSYQDIISAVNRRTYNSCYGISGARTNCFSPDGSRCEEPAPAEARYVSDAAVEIPDNDPQGITSTIEVTDAMVIAGLEVDVDIDHPWTADLLVTLEHAGTSVTLWNHVDDSYESGIHATFAVDEFDGMAALGSWNLTVIDSAAQDAGALTSWGLSLSGQ